jgi:predicted DsbA family dithiol-disulfide isomerase
MTPLSQKKRISIDIVSDVVCPWCYIGKKRLDQAIQQLQNEFEFEVTFRPFQLDPTVPETGTDFKNHLEKKFGTGRLTEMFSRVEAVGEAVGIGFDFHRIPKAINTLPLHNILQEAAKEGIEERVALLFFESYFEKGVDLTNFSNLAGLMGQFGWEENKTRDIVQDKAREKEIKEQIRHFQGLGISGVPYFIINEKYGISGAQPSETFVQTFRSLLPTDFAQSSSAACAVDGDC